MGSGYKFTFCLFCLFYVLICRSYNTLCLSFISNSIIFSFFENEITFSILISHYTNKLLKINNFQANTNQNGSL